MGSWFFYIKLLHADSGVGQSGLSKYYLEDQAISLIWFIEHNLSMVNISDAFDDRQPQAAALHSG